MLNFFNQIPLLRLLLPFITGIICFVFQPAFCEFFLLISIIFIGFLLVTIFITFFPPLHTSWRYRWVYGCFLNLTFLLGGYVITRFSTEKYQENHISGFKEGKHILSGFIASMPVEKKQILNAEIRVHSVYNNSEWSPCNGKLMASFPKNTSTLTLRYGDCLLVSGNIREIPPPKNPSEFNYKRYLSFHHIFQRMTIDSAGCVKTGSVQGNFFLRTAYRFREKLLAILRSYDLKDNEYAVASALLLGYEEDIQPSLIRAYSASGALHVLSVSGLHVGIIYLALEWLLGFISRFRYGKFWKTILILILIWFYAGITGFSPSVLRSSTMISFIIIGRNFRQQADVFNSIAVSAFLLLFFNPYLIFEVGFQLSYVAVLGIVLFYPYIFPLWDTPNRFADKVWSIIAISIAAQAATFPLGLLYFHQFPNYFIFSNLIVIPVSTIIIFLGIAVLLISPVTIIAGLLAKILVFILKFLNETVLFIERLPFAIMEGISITIAETWLIYLLVALVFSFLVFRNHKYLFSSLAGVAALLFFQVVEAASQSAQRMLVIYNVKGHSAYNFVSGNKNVFTADTSLVNNHSKMLFHIRHDWWDNNLSKVIYLSPDDTFYQNNFFRLQKPFIRFYNLNGAIIHEKLPYLMPDKKFHIDFLILGKKASGTLKHLSHIFEFKTIIFDSSVSPWRLKQWKKEAEAMKIKYYAVGEKGAYIADFDEME